MAFFSPRFFHFRSLSGPSPTISWGHDWQSLNIKRPIGRARQNTADAAILKADEKQPGNRWRAGSTSQDSECGPEFTLYRI